MKGVQCYELFGGIALKNHAFSFSIGLLVDAFHDITSSFLHSPGYCHVVCGRSSKLGVCMY